MFVIKNYKVIAKSKTKYLSFPDIIGSKQDKNKFFLVYRSGQGHHPTSSYLHFLISEDKGNSWSEKYVFPLSFKKNNQVWNCPRLSYLPDNSLNIFCDTKTSVIERSAEFRIWQLKSYNDGKEFKTRLTEMRGMVPDKIIKFKDKLYCANHTHDYIGSLTQLINYSTDKGKTWYGCTVLARNKDNAFCEASLVNYNDQYLIAYLRDNMSYAPPRNIYKYISSDGINWFPKGKLPIQGHRPTALLEKENWGRKRLILSFRNTKKYGISVLSATLNRQKIEKNIELINIEEEKEENLFHCGYTGMVKTSENKYLLVYYIQGERKLPLIKSVFLEWKN